MSKPSEICLFFGISLGSDGKIRQRPFGKNYLFQMCILF